MVAADPAALDAGARIVCLRAAPIRTAAGGRWPGAEEFDRFGGMAEEAGVTVGYHSGDSGCGRYADDWAPLSFAEDLEGFDTGELRTITRDNGRSLATPRVPAAA